MWCAPGKPLPQEQQQHEKNHGVSRVDVARGDKTVLRQRRWNQGECSIVLAAFEKGTFSCHPEDLPPGRLDFHPRWSVFPHVKSCSRLSPGKRTWRRKVRKQEWSPKSPDSNPLDFYFWSRVKRKVYEGRHNRQFTSERELIERIRSVWNEFATNKVEIRKAMKQFVPRLKAVEEKQGHSIKTLFR